LSIPRRLWHIARTRVTDSLRTRIGTGVGAEGWSTIGEIAERAAGQIADAARELEEFLSGSRTPPPPPPRTPPPPREHPLAAHYRMLGVAVGSDLTTVERAWRRLVLENHPDRFMDDPARQKQANDRLREINAAHEVLEKALQV
jgi:DnaJ-domain-containing protein 1